MSLGRFPEVGQKQKTEKYREEEKKRDQKLVIKMASYALQRHLGWHTQSRLGQERNRPKVGNNNGQLRIATQPRVAHASRLDQLLISNGLNPLGTRCDPGGRD